MSAQLKDLTRQKPLGQATSGPVKVSYGIHNLEAAIAGKSVSEVRQALKEPLNIDPRALALVGLRRRLHPPGRRPIGVRASGGGKRPGLYLSVLP